MESYRFFASARHRYYHCSVGVTDNTVYMSLVWSIIKIELYANEFYFSKKRLLFLHSAKLRAVPLIRRAILGSLSQKRPHCSP